MPSDSKLRLGLCCINTELRKKGIFSSRTVRLSTVETKGIDYVKELALQNIKDTESLLRENVKLGINVFRLSSEIFPHITNPKCGGYSLDFARDALWSLGEVARACNQRITAHPGQFNVLGSPNEEAVKNTIQELDMQAAIFDAMGMDCDSVMVIHGGGVYGDIESAKKRWVVNFGLLSESAQHRLVLENCEKCYNIQDCLDISNAIKETYGFYVPVVVDSHHYECYNILHPDNVLTNIDDLIPCVLETWLERGIRMKVHISEQGSGKIGHHSDYVENIPQYFLDIVQIYDLDLDIMIEAKMKEKSILHLYEKFPQYF